MDIVLGFIILSIPLFVFEILSRITNIKPEISRKLIHVFSSIATISLTLLLPLYQIALLALIFLLIMAFLKTIRFWKSLYNIKRKSWGEVAFPLGVLITGLIANDTSSFICAIGVMGIADTTAAIVGLKFAKKKIIRSQKSYLGSMSFAIVASIIFLLTGFSSLIYIVPGVILATIAEMLTPNGFDNTTVPVAIVLWINFI